MPTPAHTDFVPTKPDGGVDSGPQVADEVLANLLALRDSIILGFVKGFEQSRTNGTGTANQPQFITYYNSSLTIGFRLNITWTGFNPTTVAEEWTNDGAATWTNVATHVLTFDGAQNVTACTVGSGAIVLLMETWAKTLKATSDLAAHVAATGVSVHGLAGMAIQSPSAIAVTGGTEDGVDHGQTTPGKGDFKRAREVIDNSGAARVIASGGTATPDLAVAGYFKIQPNSTTSALMTIAAPANPPSSSRTQGFTLEIVNGKRDIDGRITWNAIYHFTNSAPRPADNTLQLSGSDLFYAEWNGASFDISYNGART
jgi:hypothetical protein